MQMNGRFDVNLSLHDQFLTHAWLILALRVSNLTAIERWQGRVVHLIQGPCLRRAVREAGRAAKPWPARRRFTAPVACGDSPWMLAQRGDCANSALPQTCAVEAAGGPTPPRSAPRRRRGASSAGQPWLRRETAPMRLN